MRILAMFTQLLRPH